MACGSMELRLTVLLLLHLTGGDACSRGIYRTKTSNKTYGIRTVDWQTSFFTNLLFVPAGRKMNGGCNEGEGCKEWTSKYWHVGASFGELVHTLISDWTNRTLSFVDDGMTDGFNEKGLGVHLLYLGETEYMTSKPGKNAVTFWRWARYILDTCESVSEAVEVMRAAQQNKTLVVGGCPMCPFPGCDGKTTSMPAHMAIDDPSGDSAIFEIVNKSIKIYHGSGWDYRVMTNDPAFPEQLEITKSLIETNDAGNTSRLRCPPCPDCTPEGGLSCTPNMRRCPAYKNRCLPGDVNARDRFTRLTWFLRNFNETDAATGNEKSPGVMIADLRATLLSVAVPQGAPDVDQWDHDVYPTWWYSAIDFQTKQYFWQYYRLGNLIWVDAEKLAKNGASLDEPLFIMARNASLHGDVTDLFVPVSSLSPLPKPGADGSSTLLGPIAEGVHSEGGTIRCPEQFCPRVTSSPVSLASVRRHAGLRLRNAEGDSASFLQEPAHSAEL